MISRRVSSTIAIEYRVLAVLGQGGLEDRGYVYRCPGARIRLPCPWKWASYILKGGPVGRAPLVLEGTLFRCAPLSFKGALLTGKVHIPCDILLVHVRLDLNEELTYDPFQSQRLQSTFSGPK